MVSITVAVWMLVIEGFASVVLLILFLLFTKRELESTLKETQKLLQTLDDRVNTLSNELNNTLKNTTEITSNLKNTTRKTGTIIDATGNIMQLLPFLLTQKRDTKEKNTFNTLISVARFVIAGIEGFKLVNKMIERGGEGNGRRQGK